METFGLMAAGFLHALTPLNLIAMLVSTALGITIGCLPGLSAAMGVALLLPVTFGMDPATGLIVLGGIYCGAIFGGSISAILIHTPGTPASAATAIEGYQLTLKGQAARALSMACFASFMGGLLSCLSLYFLSPILAELAMQFNGNCRSVVEVPSEGADFGRSGAPPFHDRHGSDGRRGTLHVRSGDAL